MVTPVEGLADPEGCEADSGYTDIDAGTPVTVRDGSGTVIGSSVLSAGVAGEPAFSDSDLSFQCSFAFTVIVPKVSFYTFAVGRRGEISYSYEDMKAADWKVSLSLGF